MTVDSNTLNVDLDGSTVNINGTSQDLAPAFKDVVQHYIGKGAESILQAGEDIEDYGKKLVAVGEDVGTGASVGAAIGTVFPIIGNVVGGVVGSYIGGVYGAFDQFGGDIHKILHNTLNPDDFSAGDYDRMRKRGILSGGLPNPGHAPDNEDGIIYPDGKTSGGDWPRHPGPGVQSVRGDTPYPVDIPPGMIPGPDGYPIPAFKMTGDPVVTQMNDTVRDLQLGKLADYIAGLKSIDGLVATANAQLAKPGSTAAQRKRYIDKIVATFNTLSLATRTDGQQPDLVGWRADVEKRVVQPTPVQFAGTFRVPTKNMSATLAAVESKLQTNRALTLAKLMKGTHTLVAIKLGDATSAVAAKAAVDGARAGNPQSSAQANVLALAAKLQTRQRFVDKWVHGIVHP